jgi:hypothetical protein
MIGSTKTARFSAGVTLGVVTAVTALTFLSSQELAFARATRVAVVQRIESPLGLQGTRGAGGNVGVIFNLVDEARRKTDVEVQYGIDYNADGDITDDEYRIATEDRLDSRNTRKNKAPQLFTTAGDIGAAQQYVWKSLSDVGTARLLTLEYALDPTGRPKPDPDNPGSFLFATGPDGVTPIFPGVKVRVRAFRVQKDPITGQKKKIYGDWTVSDSFGLNNNNPPSMTIDSVESNGVSVPTASDEVVKINWTAYDPDSEDLNGNGIMDVADGEDIDGDGKLDCERIGVAFDYHRLGASENPATMTADQIAALSWLPCTRKQGVGDTDSLDVRPGIPVPETDGPNSGVCSAPPGVGRRWVFAWDSVTDVGTVYAKFIFRARPFDQKRENGAYTFMKSPVQLENWRIFHQGGPNFRVDPLGSARVGHTVTPILTQNSATDPQDRGNSSGAVGFQEVLVAGGSNSLNGAAVADLDRMQVNLITAETTTVSRVARAMQFARSGHTATQLDDGRILIVGGFNAAGSLPLQSTEIYDPQSNTVVSGPNLIGARARHTAVLLASGDVAIFGGVGAGSTPLATCELIGFKPYQDVDGNPIAPSTWPVTSLPSLAVAQYSPLAALLPNQKVLVTGGVDAGGNGVTTAQLLDPLNDDDPSTPKTKDPSLTTIPSVLSQPRKDGTATVLLDGNVLFVGGSGATATASMEIYNWQFNAFEPVTLAMAAPRAQHMATLLGDGTVLIAGGSANPEAATPIATGDADIVKVGTRDPLTAQWSASQQQINGDLVTGRRFAAGATLDSGRVFLTGGVSTVGPIASSETYTPANGSNRGPRVRTILPSSEQSYLYGAPIYYRLTDPELDRARTVVQFIDRTPTGEPVWRACSPQVNTIGGDIAEFTADLATTLTDDQSLTIDPVVHNTPGDHAYIWSLERDIPRPAPGQTAAPYNVRVIPTSAVRGAPGESSPISVLFNTKIVPTILPFENYANQRPDVALPAGALTPNQGGDIKIWVHLRDLDGGAPGTNGNLASCLYEYAVDKNGDGQIKDTNGEFFVAMTPSGQPAGSASTTNPQINLSTYYNAPADSDPAFGQRPAAKGWTSFDWDSVYDIGAPATTYSNIWIRVTPSDANVGFSRIVRNLPGQPAALTVIKHPDSIYLLSWRPKFSNNKNLMPVNDPVEITFNGQLLGSSVTSSTVQFWRGTGAATSQVRGQLTMVNNGNNTATVTFYPDAQSLSNGSNVYAQTAASTVLYPNDDYSFRIPGYTAGTVPSTGNTIRPATYTSPATVGSTFSTYRLAHVLPINAGTLLNDLNYKFHTAAAGVYAPDGFTVLNLTQAPTPTTTTLARNAGQGAVTGVSLTFNRAIDPFTVASPNLTATLGEGVYVNGVLQPATKAPVVAGRWTVTNTSAPGGTSSSILQFVPVFQMPPNSQLTIAWTSGLKGFNGNALTPASFKWPVENYTRISNNTTLETFTNTTFNDTTVTSAVWGTDICAASALSGGTAGLPTFPSSTGANGALTVATNGTTILTAATGNYSTITVNKGGTLVLDSQSGPMTLLATGAITVNGAIVYKGQDGTHGVNGFTNYPYLYYGPTSAGSRAGGVGRNGGGAGGASTNTNPNANYVDAGIDGADGALATNSKGRGGQAMTNTAVSIYSRYYYGSGGGAGGGNSHTGLAGGRPLAVTALASSNGYGAASTPGSASTDAFLVNGVNGGGGGGGGGCCGYPSLSFLEGGGGGAGAGGVTILTNTTFALSATGLIDGRGGNGGNSSHYGGSGGGGAGGSLKIVAKTRATLDGVIDLRGGLGGAHGFGQVETIAYTNASAERPARMGGDGSPGRLVVLAPNYVAADEVRVYGQLMVKQIASLPTTALAATTPPTGLDGSITTTVIDFGSTNAVRYSSLTVASGATVDLRGSSNLQIFVDGNISVAGTLRLNGDSATPSTQNFGGRTRYPDGSTHLPYYTVYLNDFDANYDGFIDPGEGGNQGAGMKGNMGGGNGGDGHSNTTTSAGYAQGREAGNGSGPAPGVHNMNTTTGYVSSWYHYSGDTGGSGGANSTDGGDGWACYAVPASYNYLGAASDSSGVGTTRQSGAVTPTFPKRLGVAATDPSAISNLNLGSFVGSGGGGGNSGGDTYSGYFGMAGLGGGGAGAVALMNTSTANSASITGTIEARGGDGQTPGQPGFWYPFSTGYSSYAHAGGGGGSGGTVYIASNAITIGTVNQSTGTGGATFDLRGGLGGGYRGQNTGAGLQAYPEYLSTGGFGGNGGYGRLVLAPVTNGTVNGVVVTSSQPGKDLSNRWGMEQTSIDLASNTFKTLAGTARFYCPGTVSGGTVALSKWYDLKSVSPKVASFVAGSVFNASLTLKVEGAQSLPNSAGAGGIGDADPSNTSGLFVPTSTNGPFGILQGYRWMRWRADFTKTTSSTGGAVFIDNMNIVYTSDL